jgi:His-Xaa-Ser system radical SAM maturase HxsC
MPPLPLHGYAHQLGDTSNNKGRSVLRLRVSANRPQDPADTALVRSIASLTDAADAGFQQCMLISDEKQFEEAAITSLRRIYVVPTRFDYLSDGDLMGMEESSGQFRVHYRRASRHNSFLVTERCNHYCLMCSQPPRDINDQWILEEINASLPLIDKTTKSLGFTGGEPLLEWQAFIRTLAVCRDELPHTAVHVLSNGRAFANTEIVSAWTAVKHPNLTVGIPIYAAVDTVHDYVVQAAGAFDETVLGILKLKDAGNRVEVRVVLHAITAEHIVETARWIARNLPFVDHVALMGLENTGFAIANDKLLWIDPADYKDKLADAVAALSYAGVNVSIYNLPLCLLAASARPFAARSISDWKNGFVDECDRCDEKQNCSGFFTSGRPNFSRGIHALQKVIM